MWMGAGPERNINTAKIVTGTTGVNGKIAICGTIVEAPHGTGYQHALVCVVLKENTKGKSALPGLVLHWSTCARAGDKWLPPPRGCAQYPESLIIERSASGAAQRNPFAQHVSPDGKPLHVAMLQVSLEGVLSTGGITFVLNSGDKWLHDYGNGKDWYVQLSGFLPITTDTEDLPDAEIYPSSLAPPEGPQEADDRDFLFRLSQRTADARSEQETADVLHAQASERARAAGASTKAAREALTRAEAERAKTIRSVEAAEAGLSASKATLVAARAGLTECEAQLARAMDAHVSVTLPPAAVAAAAAAAKAAATASAFGASSGDRDAAQALAEAADAAASRARFDAQQAHDEAVWTMRSAATSAADAVGAACGRLAKAIEEVDDAVRACGAARDRADALSNALASAKGEESDAVEAARGLGEAAKRVRMGVAAELANLEKGAEDARARVWAFVRERQLVDMRRCLMQEGPRPLDLAWLLPPSLNGRSHPVVPNAFNNVRNIKSVDDEWGGAQQQQACGMEDLQAATRREMRRWLGLGATGELHVTQYKFRVRPGGGGEPLPVLAWLSSSAAVDSDGRQMAVLTIAVDARASGRPRGSLQLHWGITHREGAGPTQVLYGSSTSSETNWEAGEGCTASPLTAVAVPQLQVGAHLRALSPLPSDASGQIAMKTAQVITLQLPITRAMHSGGLSFCFKDASGTALLDAATGAHFFVDCAVGLAHNLAYAQARVTTAAESGRYHDHAADVAGAAEAEAALAAAEAEAAAAATAVVKENAATKKGWWGLR
ncbi:hypothetical protein FOA52_015882 [Chlamydomonas sp. UWO 241]|nr:hypothetical protein FOA52_015882 [Chlamydomonas sp. UWO 241]